MSRRNVRTTEGTQYVQLLPSDDGCFCPQSSPHPVILSKNLCALCASVVDQGVSREELEGGEVNGRDRFNTVPDQSGVDDSIWK